MAEIYKLKRRDVNPVLEVTVKNPDGSVHDLTGSTAWYLHIRLSDGTRLIRTMVTFGPLTGGVLRYYWVATDWDAASGATVDGAYPIGGLVAGPTLPLSPGTVEHTMEYEVIGPAPARLSYPNDEEHILRIRDDIGQGT